MAVGGAESTRVQADHGPADKPASARGDEFELALAATRRKPPSAAIGKQRQPGATPPLPTKQPPMAEPPLPEKRQPTTFGPDEPEGGIEVHRLKRGGLVPYQIYRRAQPGMQDGRGLEAMRAATASLDPKAFGSRSAALEGADRKLLPGHEIITLDQRRLGLLEQQRMQLERIPRQVHSDAQASRREAQIGKLADVVSEEVLYATDRQAVPDFERTGTHIRSRAPEDRIFQQAIDQAQVRLERTWLAHGRTPDQIGRLLEAGKAHKFEEVRGLARQQFTSLAEDLGPKASPEAVKGIIDARTAIYHTYVTGGPRYAQAIKGGADDAKTEMLVERPINQVLDIAKAGGDWHGKAIAKLREVTDPSTQRPEQVLSIVGDPRIKQLVRQSLRHAPGVDAPEQGPLHWEDGAGRGDRSGQKMLIDLSAVYGATLYADGKTPGQGKALVDEMADFIVGNTRYGGGYNGGMMQKAVVESWGNAFREAATEGNVALGLAVSAKARAADHAGFLENPPLRKILDGITSYRLQVEELGQKAAAANAFATVPVANLGKHLPAGEQIALLGKMFTAYPEKAKQAGKAVAELHEAIERREPIEFALNAYAPELKNNTVFRNASDMLKEVPEPKRPPDMPGVSPTDSLWAQRSAHRLLAETSRQMVAMYLPDDGRGGFDEAGAMPRPDAPDATSPMPWWLARSARLFTHKVAQAGFGVEARGVFDRSSRGLSSSLFAINSQALISSNEFIDHIYVPIHAMMAADELGKAALTTEQQRRLFGVDKNGSPHALFTLNRPNDVLQAAIEKGQLGADAKKWLQRGVAGTLMAPLDVLYTVADFYNSYAYATGNTEQGEIDRARGFAFAMSGLADMAFVASTASEVSGGMLLARSALWWSVVGAGLLLGASAINHYKGMYDRAHAYDAEHAKAWELLGIKDQAVAKKLGRGDALADKDMNRNAAPFLTDAFHHAGFDTARMIDFINKNWSADQAGMIAGHIMHVVSRASPDAPFNEVYYYILERFAERSGIAFPNYYTDANATLRFRRSWNPNYRRIP